MMESHPQFSVMRTRDLEQVLSIEKAAFPTPWTRTLFEQELNLSFSRHWVVTQTDAPGYKELIGYIVFWIIHDEVQLQRIAVKNSRRGQGIGSLLIKEMIRECCQEQVVKGSLEVRSGNAAALALYRKFGFSVIGIRQGYYTDTREDALVMGIEINSELP